MLLHAIMGYVCFGLNLLFQRNKPPTPPSDAEKIKRDPFFVSICKMLKNSNYIKLLIAFGCFFGIFNGMSIVLSYMLKPWFDDILPKAVSFVGGSPIISGIIGVGILGPMQRRSKVYKKWIIICMLGSSVAIALFYPLLETNSLLLVSLISAFNSFFLIPLVPIMLELGCELIFPVGEGTAVGFLFAMGNFSGFVFGNFLSKKGSILSVIV
jgi:FLVCR family feline leukemia virus subgroup C receptor-related protein